jgi:hypothetical protein
VARAQQLPGWPRLSRLADVLRWATENGRAVNNIDESSTN